MFIRLFIIYHSGRRIKAPLGDGDGGGGFRFISSFHFENSVWQEKTFYKWKKCTFGNGSTSPCPCYLDWKRTKISISDKKRRVSSENLEQLKRKQKNFILPYIIRTKKHTLLEAESCQNSSVYLITTQTNSIWWEIIPPTLT